ncbi:dual specificity tyrosine-phosphorylation-regulated kinase mbk-1-like isoform X3 [Acanthopagrus latus]|uniref:dual specificity tyrosine-phosphorylation-regulated kinase mbk-1-like isoform X3 n=1 Tax=Acanthopagrus latus TaxID=8177 RepID=UPI00187BCF97|nr:dual specificity tyrosine-phosphorylation-regulated kinase mbk-1-like isoform X3 [Acanthopagrus latus]
MAINYREHNLRTSSDEKDEANPALSFSPVKEVNIKRHIISSSSTEYLIQSFLGEGFFGQVAKCIKASTGETVAVKIMKKGLDIEAQNELAILQHLSSFDSNRYNFVRCDNVFVAREHVCLEFEMLDMSLWDFRLKRPSPCFSLKEIRPILHQMATTLQFLESTGIVHTDLKPDNIMLVDHVNQPLKIKIIDFGCAMPASELEGGFYRQALCYRSPEVILGLPLTSAIDMWSLGCIVAELFLGHVLYPVNTSYDMLRHMERTHGRIPQRLLREGYNTRRYFCKKRGHRNRWRLKTPSEFGQGVCTKSLFNSLHDLLMLRPSCHLSDEDNRAEMVDIENFTELLKKMLHLDFSKRILPSELFEDPFISMNNLADSYPNSSYVKSSFEMMKVCQRQSLSNTSTTFSASLEPNISLQDRPSWDIYQDSSVVLGIASDFSHFSIHEDQGKALGDKEKMPPGKWLKDSSETSYASGESSPEGNLPVERKMKRKWEFQRTARRKRTKMSDVSIQASASAPQVQLVHRGTQTSVTFTVTDRCSRASQTGSPERKRMKMSLHHEAPTEAIMKRIREKKWDSYIVSDTGKSAPKPDSPERKKIKISLLHDSKEAPTESLSSEAIMKHRKKRKWDSYIASDTRKIAPKPDSPERKKIKISLLHDSKEAPTESLSSEAIMKHRKKRKWDSYIASDTRKIAPKPDSPERKKIKISLLHDSKEAPTESLSSEAIMKHGKKRKWDSYIASDTGESAPKPDSPERKKMKISPLHDSKEAWSNEVIIE